MILQGFSPRQIQAISGSVSASLTATGTTQGTALALVDGINYVGTVTSGTGVRLMSDGFPGDGIVIYNAGVNPLKVYPQTGGQINGLPANTGFTLNLKTVVECKCYSATQWLAVLSA